MNTDAEHYARARRLVVEDPATLHEELDRILGGAERDLGARLEEAVRLAELALAAHLDAWWAGPVQPNVRSAIGRAVALVHDPLALGLALRLALGYARLGRVDDDAHRLATFARRLAGTGLGHPLEAYAAEAARHLDRALFLPSAEYAYGLVRGLEAEEARALAASHLARGNASFAALLAELVLVRRFDDWYVGPALPNVEAALVTWRAERPPALAELAVLLGRAYVKGGFVDLRARDHVAALLEGDEAKLLGPQEAIGFREYVDRDCFDYPASHLYARASALALAPLLEQIRRHVRSGGMAAAQLLGELALVRRLDAWYFGDPAANIRRAVQRWLESPPGEDPDADAVARTLAGLYLATLEGASHARALVRSVMARTPEAPELLDALRAAGIPADVPTRELHDLYARSVELEARVEAFRARAEAAGPLGEYERRAYEEVLRFLEREGEAPSLLDDVSRTVAAAVEVVTPEALVRSATAAVEDVLRLAVSGASAALRKDRIVAELARRDPRLRSLERIRDGGLELLDEVAWSITHENRVAAALDGLGCGLGGPTLVLVDVPMLLLVNLNAVAAIATVYGFDPGKGAERDFLVALLAGGAPALRQRLALDPDADGAEGPDPDGAGPEGPRDGRAALELHAAAAEIAARIARMKLLQIIPILGGAVGAGLNFHYTHGTTKTAVMAYRYRWLLRRFGMDRAPG